MRNRPPRLTDWLTSLLLLGGIGVSGRMPDDDERLARIGLGAIKQE